MGTFRNGKITQFKSTAPTGLPDGVQRLLRQQHDAVAFRQLREHGLSPRAINNRLRGGVLRPLPGRVLTTRHGTLPRETQRWAALLATSPKARLTGCSALAVDGIIERDLGGDVYVLVEGSSPRRTSGVIVQRTTVLDPADCRITEGGYPGVSTARALCDAAAFVTTEELAQYLDRAVMLGRFDAERLDTLLKQRRNWKGRHKLIEALGTLDENTGKFLSVFELKVKRLMATSTRIPPVAVNAWIDGLRPDINPRGTAAIIECDGRDYHRSPAQIVADSEREERLRALGYEFLRLRWADLIYAPEQTLARIEAFVLAHLAPPVPRPA